MTERRKNRWIIKYFVTALIATVALAAVATAAYPSHKDLVSDAAVILDEGCENGVKAASWMPARNPLKQLAWDAGQIVRVLKALGKGRCVPIGVEIIDSGHGMKIQMNASHSVVPLLFYPLKKSTALLCEADAFKGDYTRSGPVCQ